MEFLGAPIDIKDEVSSNAGNWTTIPANSLFSGATNLLLQGQTTDLDIGGNSNCELVCRENASGPEVTIIDHDGTSATRSVAVEQAIIPCSSDGSFDIKFTTNGNIAIAHLKIVGYSLGGAASSGAGGLCRLSAAESGYQMFSNGFTIQWMSSPAFTTESSQVVNFPIPFASKPFKVIASTRFPSAAVNTHETMQVVSWNSESVTILAQSITGNFSPVYADIIAIGLATPVDCSGGDGGSAADGVKISQLQPLSDLKDDDLFVLSRDNESDGLYDNSNKITFDQIKTNVLSSVPDSSSSVTFVTPKLILASNPAFNPTAFQQIDLSDDLPIGAQGCILQVEYYVTGPDSLPFAEIYLREEENSATQYKILFTAAFGGGDAVASNVQGFYPIHKASRSVWIGIPERGPNRYEIYLIGYF